MEFVNLTPHSITIIPEKGKKVEIPSMGIARLKQEEIPEGRIGDIPIVSTIYRDLEIPEGVDITGKWIIVSSVVAQGASQELLARGARGVLVPNTGPTPNGAVRDENGRIVGVRSLILVAGKLL